MSTSPSPAAVSHASNAPAAPPDVEIMTIGDELLYGQVIDTNSAFMGQELGKIGLRVRQISSVSDRAEEIVAALDQARQRARVVLITGGLGPTKDDLTKHVLARYFGTELVLHEPTLRHVEEIFQRVQRPMLDVNRQQALAPCPRRCAAPRSWSAPRPAGDSRRAWAAGNAGKLLRRGVAWARASRARRRSSGPARAW